MVCRRLRSHDRHSLPEQVGALSGRAAFSTCGSYRWWLERIWRPEAPRLLFLGLNPSLADRDRDDPTLRRLIGFATSWGFGGLEVLNLFARVAPQPDALRRCDDPVGAATDDWIRARLLAFQQVGPALPLVWLGWGNGGGWCQRDRQVLKLLDGSGVRLACLGCTASGQPLHPLYRPARSRLLPFAPFWGERPADASALPCPAFPVATPSTWF
jgi:hypothetical protein